MFRMKGLREDGKSIVYDGRTGEKFDNPVTVGYKMCIRDRHKIVADVSQPNAFPIEDPELLRALEQRFEEIPAPAYEGFAGLADDLIRAIETDTQPVSSGESGRATLELIAAIYESGATGRTVQLLSLIHIYTVGGLLHGAVRQTHDGKLRKSAADIRFHLHRKAVQGKNAHAVHLGKHTTPPHKRCCIQYITRGRPRQEFIDIGARMGLLYY